MPKSSEQFNSELEEFLRGCGVKNIQPADVDGKPISDPEVAEQFKFNYRNGNKTYGTAVLTVNGGTVTVYYNSNSMRGSDPTDSGWTDFLANLKDWALRSGQHVFKTANLDDLDRDMKRIKKVRREEKILESWWGNKNTSYGSGAPTVKLVIKHTKQLGEGDLRYHHIDRIFLENSIGERILVPSKKPSVGRAFARHIAEGGQYNDERWNHIKELAEDAGNLGGFLRATKHGGYGTGVQDMLGEAEEKYTGIRSTIRRLSSKRGYDNYFESWQPTLLEADGQCDYSDLFTSRSIDSRIERAIPTLQRLGIGFKNIREANEFQDWADNVLEGLNADEKNIADELVELLNDDDILTVGPDAINIKGLLEDLLPDSEERQDLFNELSEIAGVDPDSSAKPAIIAWLQKNSGDKFFDDILDQVEIDGQGNTQPPQTPPDQEQPPPAPKQQPAQNKPELPAGLGPAPLSEGGEISRLIKLSGIK